MLGCWRAHACCQLARPCPQLLLLPLSWQCIMARKPLSACGAACSMQRCRLIIADIIAETIAEESTGVHKIRFLRHGQLRAAVQSPAGRGCKLSHLQAQVTAAMRLTQILPASLLGPV